MAELSDASIETIKNHVNGTKLMSLVEIKAMAVELRKIHSTKEMFAAFSPNPTAANVVLALARATALLKEQGL
jgi:hypothetical protein